VARMLEHMSSEPRAKPGVAEAIGYAKSLVWPSGRGLNRPFTPLSFPLRTVALHTLLNCLR
jgi:hypothetical protein